MKNVIILALPGCMASSVHGIVDNFTVANLAINKTYGSNSYTGAQYFNTKIVSSDGQAINTASGQVLIPECELADITEKPDLVVLSSAFTCDASSKAITHYLDQQTVTLAWLSAMHKLDVTLASACTGCFVLAQAGIFAGKQATTHWLLQQEFQQRYPQLTYNAENVIIEYDNLLSGAAVTAFNDLCLRLISRFSTREIAMLCAKIMLTAPYRELQKPFQLTPFIKNHQDAKVLQAQEWMEAHYTEKIKIDDIAEHLAMGSRNFKRRFKQATSKTPLSYLQQLRIEASKHQLEMTHLPSHEIIWKVGYEDLSSFRRLFKKTTGLTMDNYRKQFSVHR